MMSKSVLLIASVALGVGVVAVLVLTPRMAQRYKPAVIAETPPQTTERRTGSFILAEVTRIYVEPVLSMDRPSQKGAVSVENPALKHTLAQAEMFTVVDSRDEADAVFSLREELVCSDKTETYRTGPIARVWRRDTTANVEATLRDAKTGATLWTSRKTKTVYGAHYYHELDSELVEQLKPDHLQARSRKH